MPKICMVFDTRSDCLDHSHLHDQTAVIVSMPFVSISTIVIVEFRRLSMEDDFKAFLGEYGFPGGINTYRKYEI